MELSADQLRLAGGAVALAVLGGGGCLAAACCCTGPAEGSKRSKGPRAAGGKARRAGAESGSGKADTAKKKGKGSNDEGGKKTAKKKKKKGSRAPAATSAGDSPSAAAAAAAATEVPHEPGWLTLGLTEHGLGRYAGDFRDLKIDQETCAMYFLGEDSGENWDELFSGDLRAVRPKDRKALKSQIQSIYDYSAEMDDQISEAEREQADAIAEKYLGPKETLLSDAAQAIATEVPRVTELPYVNAKNGVTQLELDKKYEGGVIKVPNPWQKRTFYFMPHGDGGHNFPCLFWADSHGNSMQKAPVHLEKCTRITTNNRMSYHFELHGCYTKLIQLRAPNPDTWRKVIETFDALSKMGCLAPGNDGSIQDAEVGVAPEAAKAQSMAPSMALQRFDIGIGNIQPDGSLGVFLEKKSGSVKGTWQERWFKFRPDGGIAYFKGETESGDSLKNEYQMKDVTGITSNNVHSGHFELHGCDPKGKVVQLRTKEKDWQSLTHIENLFVALAQLGWLGPRTNGSVVYRAGNGKLAHGVKVAYNHYNQ